MACLGLRGRRALIALALTATAPAVLPIRALAQPELPCFVKGRASTLDSLRVLESCTASERNTVTQHATTQHVGSRGRITVIVAGLAEYRAAYAAQPSADRDPLLDPSQFILFVDDRPLPRFFGRLPDREHSHLTFDLDELARRTLGNADSSSAWKLLLSDGVRDRAMRLSVGFSSRGPIPSDVIGFKIEAVEDVWRNSWYALAAGLLVLLVWAGRASDMLRVPGDLSLPAKPDGTSPRKAYSLARVQMAAWFYAVLITYLFIYLATGALDTITSTVLGLMGISAATGLAATVVDVGTAVTAPAVAAAPGAALPGAAAPAAGAAAIPVAGAPRNEWFLKDLLHDGSGLSLPRLQIAVWTLVLLFIFGRAVYQTLAMPEFSGTLLGLMGISGGTYIGFKPPDKKS